MTTGADDQSEHFKHMIGTTTGTLIERLGIQITEVAPGRIVGIMPVEGNTQPYGLLHGGASVPWPRPWAQSAPRCTPGPAGSRWASTSTPPTTARRPAGP